MTNDDVIFRHRLPLFARAGEVGVRRACREAGLPPLDLLPLEAPGRSSRPGDPAGPANAGPCGCPTSCHRSSSRWWWLSPGSSSTSNDTFDRRFFRGEPFGDLGRLARRLGRFEAFDKNASLLCRARPGDPGGIRGLARIRAAAARFGRSHPGAAAGGAVGSSSFGSSAPTDCSTCSTADRPRARSRTSTSPRSCTCAAASSRWCTPAAS